MCEQPTLHDVWWSDEIGDDADGTPIFPAPRDNSAVPAPVLKHLREAKRVRSASPSYYAVGIGRMLEAICRAEGITKGTLGKRLRVLADQGRIPDVLAEAGDWLREFRNLGAHDDEIDVLPQDLPLIEDFAEAILEYMYRAPAKIAAVQTGLQERRRAAASPEASAPTRRHES